MYKVGDRFIIEIEEVFTGKATGYPQYRIKGFDKLVMDDRGLVKLSKYEDKQKQDAEIKVGYEVYNLDRDNKRIVTAIDGNKAIQLCSDGKYTVDNIDTLHWTGREDLRIKKVLEKITGETDGYTSDNRSDNIQRP